MIKGVIFDFGFTLFYFDNPSVERYYECFKQGLMKSIDLLKEKQIWNDKLTTEAFLQKFSKKRQSLFRKSIKTKIEFPTSIIFQKVLGTLEEEGVIDNLDNLIDTTYKKLANIYHSCEEDEWMPFAQTKEMLEKLALKDVKVALLSNHPNHKTIKNIIIKHDLTKYFDVILTSAKFGKRKPDPDIFYFVLDKIGLKNDPSSVIMCGDEYADISGAQRTKIQPILFERKYKFPFEKEIENPDYRKINNISEILDYVI